MSEIFRNLLENRILETLDSDSDDDFDIPHSSDDSETSSDSDDEQPVVGSRCRPNTVPSQDESRSSSTSDEAETVVDQCGWRIVNEDQNRSRSRLDPAFTVCKASCSIDYDCTQPIQFFLYFSTSTW